MSYSTSPNALEKQYCDALRSKGISVSAFNHGEYSFKQSISGKMIHRLYPEFYWNVANKKLLEAAENEKPEIIVIFKGMDIYPTTLMHLRKRGIKLVNYNPDHPFIFHSRGSGNQNVLNSIPVFDLHVTYSMHIASSFRNKYPNLKIQVLPFGYGLIEEEYHMFNTDKEVLRGCFVGYADRERAAIIENVIKQGLKMDVYGDGWLGFFPNPSPLLKIHGAENGLDYYRTLHRYRVQLNLFRGHNVNAHNMRSFEVPAAGGIMLAPDTIEHRQFFRVNSEVFLYKSTDEIPAMATKILKLSAAEAMRIRNNARARSIDSGYDYASRAAVLLEMLKEL